MRPVQHADVPDNNAANPSTESIPRSAGHIERSGRSDTQPLPGDCERSRTPATTPAIGPVPADLAERPGARPIAADTDTQLHRSHDRSRGREGAGIVREEPRKSPRVHRRQSEADIAITGTEGEDYPFECTIDDGQMHAGRCWEQITYMWKASAMCHKPLYFEDEQLERYGHSFTPCFQPFVSGAHFFCTCRVLPYCMGVEPPCECIYALGHYRPGSCAPYMCNPSRSAPRRAVPSGRGRGHGGGDTVVGGSLS